MRRPLVPVPVGLDGPTKEAAGHAERTWEALGVTAGATSACIAAAVIAGAVVVAPAAPLLAAVAAVSGIFKLRAKWAKEDPPRLDFEEPFVLDRRFFDPVPVLEPALPAGSRLLAVVEAGSTYLDATVVSLEKAMGAGRAAHRTLDQRTALVGAQRTGEAYYYAGLAHPVLASINDACDEFATQLLAFDAPTFHERHRRQSERSARRCDSRACSRHERRAEFPRHLAA